MLCMSERVETAQGDPRTSFGSAAARLKTLSYGNRLFCDYDKDRSTLVHRWGSTKLYRAHFQDYRAFIARPEYVAEQYSDNRIAIVHSDLKQFYDRVRPTLFASKLRNLKREGDDEEFFALAEAAFNWQWHPDDLTPATDYARDAGIDGFERVALPQGLVASGFFANVILLEFDQALRGSIDNEVTPGIFVKDACRYVDDLRITVAVSPGVSADDVESQVAAWLDGLIRKHAPDLQLSFEKTKATLLKEEEHPLIRQARKMQRIQTAISGGFDAAGGEEVIQAVQGLVRSQAELALTPSEGIRALTPTPDVKDETLGRFAAGRFRKTYRSLRPLLDTRSIADTVANPKSEISDETFRRARMTQEDLDDEAHAFSLRLLGAWLSNPSYVRLLRVAVDLWPTRKIAETITSLLEPFLSTRTQQLERKVAFYCLSELLRAGATETGIVPDAEMLPSEADLGGYRDVLLQTAVRVVAARSRNIPWFLKQQAFLFLLVHGRNTMVALPVENQPRELAHYVSMKRFLGADANDLSEHDFAKHAVVVRRSLLSSKSAVELIAGSTTSGRLLSIAERDLEFARELFPAIPDVTAQDTALSDDLMISEWSIAPPFENLGRLVKSGSNLNPLRNEIGVLTFASAFLRYALKADLPPVITPANVQLRRMFVGNYSYVEEFLINTIKRGYGYRSVYTPPSWLPMKEIWRFQLGFLLRYILTAQTDFSVPVRAESCKEVDAVYRPTRSHWLQRLYGFFNGHEAFGDDWLPMSEFSQDMLYTLLSWPGCRAESRIEKVLSIEGLLSLLDGKLDEARKAVGESTGILILRLKAPLPAQKATGRPLRACVVQTITPEGSEIHADIAVSSASMRRKHRNHLSTALAAVEKMLDLRDTHKNQNKRLDWLILPELSVHPSDVATHLVPFARAFKTIILAGLTYRELFIGRPLVNTALWVIPRMVFGHGLQVITRLQGKQHLAPLEQGFNDPVQRVMSFRPCQWLIGYEWSDTGADPLWLTGAICYDATDLKLASDLRDRSDVFAIPAFNQDVGTFDHMAQALHYHMYQLVLVANNGAFGGSNAYVPQGEVYKRQVFHTHGQPQATISFFEIEAIDQMKQRRTLGKQGLPLEAKWKYPPAGC